MVATAMKSRLLCRVPAECSSSHMGFPLKSRNNRCRCHAGCPLLEQKGNSSSFNIFCSEVLYAMPPARSPALGPFAVLTALFPTGGQCPTFSCRPHSRLTVCVQTRAKHDGQTLSMAQLGQMWKGLSDAQKKPYQERAAAVSIGVGVGFACAHILAMVAWRSPLPQQSFLH